MEIAIVGDFNPAYVTHEATDSAFAALGVEARWIPTLQLQTAPSALAGYDGVLIAPGSPYVSMAGALVAIRYARERRLPLLGTCGGFQHVLIEFARNRLGIDGADHAETKPEAAELLVVPLACSLVGQRHPIEIAPDSLASSLYNATETVEPFFCSFGLNPGYRARLEEEGMRFSGFDLDGEPRILELPEHPFFLATLYVPQAASTAEAPHPLLTGFLEACRQRLLVNRDEQSRAIL